MKYSNLSVHSYAGGITVWTYKTDCVITAISTPEYFNEAAPYFKEDDILHIVGGGKMATRCIASLQCDAVVLGAPL